MAIRKVFWWTVRGPDLGFSQWLGNSSVDRRVKRRYVKSEKEGFPAADGALALVWQRISAREGGRKRRWKPPDPLCRKGYRVVTAR